MIDIDPATKDMVFENGAISEVSGLTAVGHRVRDRLYTFTNEWFLDSGFGVPQLEQILGQANPNLVTIAAIFKREARKSLQGEAALTSLNVKLERATRDLTVSMVITSLDGVSETDNFIL